MSRTRAAMEWSIRVWMLAIVIAALEGVSYVGLWVLPRLAGVRAPRASAILHDQTTRAMAYLTGQQTGRARGATELDPLLGWHYRASYANGGDQINTQRVRSLHAYAPHSAAGVVRVAAFGDSFVYGNEVDTKDAWTSIAEQLYPDLEILNYGVGGYGDDQAYLRYVRDGRDLSPSVVILAFMADDLRRLTNVYRRFIDDRELALTKPRFFLARNGTLTLQLPPLRDSSDMAQLARNPRMALRFGDHDQWYESPVYLDPLYDYSATVRLVTTFGIRVYNRFIDRNRLLSGDEFNPSSEAFRLQLAIASRFVLEAQQAGQTPLLLMLPDRVSVQQSRTGRRPVYAGLVDSLRGRGLPVADLTSAFLGEGNRVDPSGWFAAGGHYSPRGNAIIARAVGREIREVVDGQGDR